MRQRGRENVHLQIGNPKSFQVITERLNICVTKITRVHKNSRSAWSSVLLSNMAIQICVRVLRIFDDFFT